MLGNHRSGGRVAAEKTLCPKSDFVDEDNNTTAKTVYCFHWLYGVKAFKISNKPFQFMKIYKDALLAEAVSSTGIIII